MFSFVCFVVGIQGFLFLTKVDIMAHLADQTKACLALLLACGLLAGCGKVPTWGELTGTAQPEAEPAPVVVAPAPPAHVAPPAPVAPVGPTPEQMVADFKAMKPYEITDGSLAAVAGLESGTDQITEINAAGSKLTNEGLAALERLPALASLNLESTAIDDNGCDEIAKARGLTTLMMDGGRVTDVGAAQLSNLPALKVLHLNRARLTVEGFRILSTLPELEEVWLDESSITDQGLLFLSSAVKLKRLKLAKTSITDNGIAQLSKLDQLEYLDISYTGLRGEGLLKLSQAKALKNMKFLSVQGTAIGDAGGRAIAAMKSLEGLDLGSLPSMKDVHLVAMIKNLDELTYLNLHDSTGISSAGLIPFRKHQKLEKLHLTGGLNLINDAGLGNLKDIKTLKELQLGGTGCTPFGIAALREAIPGLKVTGQ